MSDAPDRAGTDGPAWPGDAPLEERRERSGSHLLVLGLILGLTAVLVLLAVLVEADPRGYGTHEQLGLWPCRMKQLTGLPCPGCGVTTSVTHAVQGRPLQSLRVQPLGLLVALALPPLSVWALVVHRRGGDLYAILGETRVPWVRVTLVVAGLAWVYKLFAG